MGGRIFQQGANALTTPRMPKEVYDHMCKHVCEILDHLKGPERIEDCKIPIPVPGKEHFGDIDVLVYKTLGAEDLKEGGPDFRPFLMQLQQELGAVRKTRTTNDFSASYAIPWPAKYEVTRDETLNKSLNGLNLAPEHHFVQIDVKVTNSRALFKWQWIVDSHSGPFMFLGPSLDAVCLKGEPKGFYLRVQEMKDEGMKSGSFIHLTCDPKEMCDIVGWDCERLTNPDGFKTTDELFGFITSSHFFDPKAYKVEEIAAGEGSVSSEGSSNSSSNRSDRNKEKRELLRTWYKDFLPHLLHHPSYTPHKIPSAHSVREEMFLRFPQARDAYQAKLEKFLGEQRDAKVRRAIRVALPRQGSKDAIAVADQHVHNFAVAGLKELLLGDSIDRDDLVDTSKRTKYPLPDLPNLDPRDANEKHIADWIREHWKAVGLWRMWAAPGDALLDSKTKTKV